MQVTLANGEKAAFWNTFYQKVTIENGKEKYFGQIDLNAKSIIVKEFYQETINKLAEYGAKIIRLDAFAYVAKEAGRKNFFNTPETWDLLEELRQYASKKDIELLPEIHSSYLQDTHKELSKKGYLIYDFFLPGLIIDAIENSSSEYLAKWAKEIIANNITSINMLGCHDGIPILDLSGILDKKRIDKLVATIIDRGGIIKDLQGKTNMYYQVNATYFSALNENIKKLLLARAIQLFMPGIPQIWYLDLFAGCNDYSAISGEADHKNINRTNYSKEEVEKIVKQEQFVKQVKLISFRNKYRVFQTERKQFNIKAESEKLFIEWKIKNCYAKLEANLSDYSFSILAVSNGNVDFEFIEH